MYAQRSYMASQVIAGSAVISGDVTINGNLTCAKNVDMTGAADTYQLLVPQGSNAVPGMAFHGRGDLGVMTDSATSWKTIVGSSIYGLQFLQGSTSLNGTLVHSGQVLQGVPQTISAASGTITASSNAQLTISGGPFTMTSAPTIANSSDGHLVRITNVSGAAITLQDQGTLANSNLRLVATTRTLNVRDSIWLMFSTTVGDWVEVGGFTDVL